MVWNITQFIVNLFQSIVVYKTMDLYYEHRFKFKYIIELFIVATTVILSFINYNFSIQQNPYIFFVFYFILLGLNILLFKGNPISKIFSIFLVIALIGLSELVSATLVFSITGMDFSVLNENNFGKLLTIITSQTLIMFSYLMLRKSVSKKKMNLQNNMYYLLVGSIMFMTVSIIIIVIWLYGNLPGGDGELSKYLVYLTLGVSLNSVFSIALSTKILNDIEEKHKLDLELQQMKLEQKYILDINSALDELRKLRHNMRGELAILHGYNELEQRDKIRNHIEKMLKEMEERSKIEKQDKDSNVAS